MSKPRAPAADPRQPDLIQVTRPRARDPIGAALRDAYDPDDTLPDDWIELLAAIDQSSRRGGGHEHG
ncbi:MULTISPECIES: hypothetical protein [unclassified Sphingomonas]|jgi:hypothetical protein|uniref:hypothetical protein n=1 Tax=unclassified Sphingomonas TaxID=196159 RepID=UPI00082EFAB4|nr:MULTISPECIES: hypothetical protein [unclassified Sphingomonas]MCH4892049.1 hypothetical protein [Sphingomonas sp. SFZ2018-12]